MQQISGGITAPSGFLSVGVRCGLKTTGNDLAIIYSQEPSVAAAVFTANRFCAAPISISRQHLASASTIQAIVVNSGCANCATGEQGLLDAQRMTEIVAAGLNISSDSVLVASTGKIGTFLLMNKIETGIHNALSVLSRDGCLSAAEAIMTTDTRPKQAAVEIIIQGKQVNIGGMAKGAGMIAPNMATMLSFLTTDAMLPKELLNKMLQEAVNGSFNSITIDGDTSTNDMVAILANGASGIVPNESDLNILQAGLNLVCLELATMIIRDAEGATKLVRILVKNAPDKNSAKIIGLSIANSTLVKCAVFGADPNWGRILCAIGNTGVEIDLKDIDVYVGKVQLVRNSCARGFDHAEAHQLLSMDEVELIIDLKQGTQEAVVLGCDLTTEYVSFNAHYST
ncbi:bifunctional glutamate N-acetyltransferase/amino-acid acetyltransferase ArgJ [bacterium]|nr:bifunctional glutamate N-acetyltransferase/amino-acid acetyltransferase ArgJ [bacterium]MBU1753618.1 bifunctional glutamate N-acetyltransferase/amino-acid acetyltransferase ArgJ [bacterium]